MGVTESAQGCPYTESRTFDLRVKIFRLLARPDGLVDLGCCGICFAPILLHPVDAARNQDEKNNLRHHHESQVYDTPTYGVRLLYPLPAYPCGHRFIAELYCHEREDGRYIYR